MRTFQDVLNSWSEYSKKAHAEVKFWLFRNPLFGCSLIEIDKGWGPY